MMQRSRFRFSAAFVAVSLALTACGSADAGSEGARTKGKVRILLAASTTGFAEVIIASEAGYLAEEGITPEILPPIANAATQVQSTVTGDADVAGASLTALFFAEASGRDVVAFAKASNTQNGVVLVTPEFVRKAERKGITPTSKPADRVRALADARMGVATRGPGTEASIRALFKHFDVAVDDSTFVALGSPAGLDSGLKSKRVDGVYTGLPAGLNPVKNDYGTIWLGPGDYAKLPPWSAGNIAYMSSRSWAEKNPGTVAKFGAALDRARKLIADDPLKAAELYLKFAPENDPELTRQTFQQIKINYAGGSAMDENYFAKNLTIYNEGADAPSGLTFSKGVWQGK